MPSDFDYVDAAQQGQLRPRGAVGGERPHAEAAASPADAIRRLQRQVGNAAVGSLLEEGRSPVHDVVGRGGGQPLPTQVRQRMEARLGADFSDVRVHTDHQADASAKSVNAHAYTVGSDVVFQHGRYDPSSTDGQRTLAHELTHVVQQRQGPVDGAPAPGGVKVSDPSDRFEQEAERVADQVIASPTAPASDAAPSAQRAEASEGSSIQRQAAEEQPEEQVQGSFVQRQEEEPEDEVQGSFVQRQAAEEQPEEEPATA